MLGIQIYPRKCHERFHPSVLRNDCSLRVHRLFNDCVKVRSWIVKVQPQRKVCFLNSPHHTLKMSFLFRLCIIYICTCTDMHVQWVKFQRNYSPEYNYWFMGYYQSYFPYHVMVFVLFSLSCDTIRVKAWFPYRCICRVCRTKKIHRTDRIHSISYNKLYLSFLLY